MIERAFDGERAFDVIIVHSFSRFFRDAFGLEFYVRKLAKHGVKLVSITQELGDDPAQVMMRQVIALFDEYQSKENAKHVLRAMKENVRQGYWNGSLPPYGYVTVEAERRGARVKKKLAIESVEAELVRMMFKLFLKGIDGSGPNGSWSRSDLRIRYPRSPTVSGPKRLTLHNASARRRSRCLRQRTACADSIAWWRTEARRRTTC